MRQLHSCIIKEYMAIRLAIMGGHGMRVRHYGVVSFMYIEPL